jgi:hypothetical protein
MRVDHTGKSLSMSRDPVHWMDGSRLILIALVVAEEARSGFAKLAWRRNAPWATARRTPAQATGREPRGDDRNTWIRKSAIPFGTTAMVAARRNSSLAPFGPLSRKRARRRIRLRWANSISTFFRRRQASTYSGVAAYARATSRASSLRSLGAVPQREAVQRCGNSSGRVHRERILQRRREPSYRIASAPGWQLAGSQTPARSGRR